MALYIILGTYSNKGSEGLVEGSSDRRKAMETLTSSVGAKLINYHITRGIYDFTMQTEAESFDQIVYGVGQNVSKYFFFLGGVDMSKKKLFEIIRVSSNKKKNIQKKTGVEKNNDLKF